MKNIIWIYTLGLIFTSCTTIDQINFSSKNAQGYNKRIDNILIAIDYNENNPLCKKLSDEISLAFRSVNVPSYFISASINESNRDDVIISAIEKRLNYVTYLKTISQTSEVIHDKYLWQNNRSPIVKRKHESIFVLEIIDVEYKTIIWRAQIIIDDVVEDYTIEEFKHDLLISLKENNLLSTDKSEIQEFTPHKKINEPVVIIAGCVVGIGLAAFAFQ